MFVLVCKSNQKTVKVKYFMERIFIRLKFNYSHLKITKKLTVQLFHHAFNPNNFCKFAFMTRAEFIEKNKHLFWYIKPDKIKDISNDVLVEFIFNYGTWDDVKELIRIIGYPELKRVYENITGRNVGNYFPPVYNFLSLIIQKYAS